MSSSDPAAPEPAAAPAEDAEGSTGAAGASPPSEPPEATHQAEDQVWDTGGDDAPHRLDAADELEAENQRLREELEALRLEVAQAKDRALRARADYDNLQKRTAAEALDADARSTGRVLTRLLDTYEVLQLAVADADKAGVDDAWTKGVRLALDGFERALREEGLEPVPGVGEPFDHRLHQAVAKEPADAPEDVVVEIVRPGYVLKGKLLREALVKVSAGSSDA